MIARRLGMDPLQLRRLNLLATGEPYRRGDTVIDSDLALGLEAVADRIGWGHTSRPASPHLARGKGLAIGFKIHVALFDPIFLRLGRAARLIVMRQPPSSR